MIAYRLELWKCEVYINYYVILVLYDLAFQVTDVVTQESSSTKTNFRPDHTVKKFLNR